MPQLAPSAAHAFLGGVMIAGLVAAWLARFTEGSRHAHWYQRLFFFCLLNSGMATIAALLSSPGACVMAGATLAVTVLAATWDFSPGRRVAA